MIIYAQDPSFRALAYSLYDGNGTIYINKVSSPLGSKMTFERIYDACQTQWYQLSKSIDTCLKESAIDKIDKAVSEIPPPVGQFSSGLFALDTFIIDKFNRTYQPEEFYIIPPTFVGTVHGTRKYKKSDSTELANFLLSTVYKEYHIRMFDTISESGRHMKGKMNNDKAESLLFLSRMFVKYNIDNKAKEIVESMSGFGEEREKLLSAK